MSITIPVWLLWTGGVIGAVVLLAAIAFVCALAFLGLALVGAFGKGLKW